MAGYPGTIAATWQRAGRAGRRASRSAAVLVASQRAARSVHRAQPVVFLRRAPRSARSSIPTTCTSSSITSSARRSSCRSAGGEAFGRHDLQEILASWPSRAWCIGAAAASIPSSPTTSQWTWTSESYPADAVSLRSVSSDNFVVVDTTREPRVIGETDFTSGPATLHPKAIYIVEGAAVSGGEARLRGTQGVRPRDRLRLLHRRDHLHAGHDSRHVRERAAFCGRRQPRAARTAKSTSSRASSGSRRSSSTRTRTSGRASWICPSSRCTRQRTG